MIQVLQAIVFNKLVSRLVLGGAYTKHADHQVSSTTLRTRRDEWTTADVLANLEHFVLEAFDWLIGLELEHLMSGRVLRRGQYRPEPTDRGKSGQKRSVLCTGHGLPIGVVLAGVDRHDSPLLRPSLERWFRFGLHLPQTIRVDLDAGYDSGVTRVPLTELGCGWKICPKGT